MTTKEMLEKIQFSQNENCANVAKRILSGETTIEKELKYTGGFMTAVLHGNYASALMRADADNTEALRR